MYEVTKSTTSMVTRDGVRLDADVYYPVTGLELPSQFPVLVMRQPYGRAIASTVTYAHPHWYAAHGYIVVIQDVRGRGTSEGDFHLFIHEIDDGEDTINWAAQLPGSSGAVGMYGFSYQGMTQLYAAIAAPAPLKTICPAMVAYDLYRDWAYEGGAFKLETNLSWAIQLATETARRRSDPNGYQQLISAANNLPLSDRIPAYPQCLTTYAKDSFYHDWIHEPQSSSYWANLSPKTYFQRVRPQLPMLHIGGWFDFLLQGTINVFQAMTSSSPGWGEEQSPYNPLHHLIIGPWSHIPWGRVVGSRDYGSNAVNPCDSIQLRWFNHFLKGIDTGLLDEQPVQLFELGSNEWRQYGNWPAPVPQAYRLHTTGLASHTQDAQLVGVHPDPSFHQHPSLPDILIHDPWRPVPTLGGHATLTAGSFNRSWLDCRGDVLIYTSAPLSQDLHLAGAITLELYVGSDRASFDLCATLSEVEPNGHVYNFSQGYGRVDSEAENVSPSPYPPPPQASLILHLQPACIRIPAGHAVRLSISGACFPAFPVNPGTGCPLYLANGMESLVTTIVLWSHDSLPSRLWLPIAG